MQVTNHERAELALDIIQILHGVGLGMQLDWATNPVEEVVFVCRVANPTEYSMIEFVANGKVVTIEEKSVQARSDFAIPCLFFSMTKSLKLRVMLNQVLVVKYHKCNEGISWQGEDKGRGTSWLDTRTFNALHEASTYVRIIKECQGEKN